MCADIGHCRQQDKTALFKSTSCPVSNWHLMIESCTCPPSIGIPYSLYRIANRRISKSLEILIILSFSEVCFIVKRPFIYASHGGELKIHIDGTEIATYPDNHFGEERYCPEQIQDGALITFDAVTNDQVNSIRGL